MRFLATFLISTTAFAQAQLIGVNSTATELPAGARDTVTSITVDPSAAGGDLLAVMLTTEGIRIEIELPDGRRVTRDNASQMGFAWEVEGQGQGGLVLLPGLQGKVNHLVLLPPKSPAGKYLIHADSIALSQASALVAVFLPSGGGAAGQRDTVRVALSSTQISHYVGETVQLVAGVFDGNRGVNNAQLSAQAFATDENGMPRGQAMPVLFTLSRSGTDGSYVAELPTTAAGKYDVVLKVKGRYADGTDFERGASTSIEIEPRRAQILSVTERPHLDGNGLIDRIEVTARVKVELPGEYSLTVDLVASTHGYMQGYGKAHLGVGEATITASFERSMLSYINADGPYDISARLFRQEGLMPTFASVLEKGDMTRAYKLANFARGPI